jgi:hypothetical protein
MNSESDLILSRLARDLNVITDVERTEQQQHDAGGQVGERPLQREADRQVAPRTATRLAVWIPNSCSTAIPTTTRTG